MSIITKNEIEILSKVHDPYCISVFIPTHRYGQAVLEEQDSILLGNQLKNIVRKLESENLKPKEIDKKTFPLQTLIEDKEFWRQQSDGLAIFIANGFVKTYTLPISFEPLTYIANNFYVKPILPMLTGDGRFFILALELEEVHFYEATRDSISEVIIKDLTPSRLEERVGTDFRQKSLQYRTQQEGHGGGSFHGHGEGKEDHKNEISRYFRSINEGLMTLLHDESSPLLVACIDYFFPIYEEVNTYQNLSGHLAGNPSDLDPLQLHEKAWKHIKPIFDVQQKKKWELYQQFHDTFKTSTKIDKIIPAAIDGRIDTLFLVNDTDIFGVYNKDKAKVRISEKPTRADVSLTNLVATEVILHGGQVYLLEKDEMPDRFYEINALYRY